MKKNLVHACLTLACLLCAPGAFAQLAEDRSFNIFSFAKSDNGNDEKVTFGVRTGLNISSVSEKSESEGYNSSRVNINLGISADVPVFNGFYLQTGLYLSNKGWNYKDDAYDDYQEEATIKLSYLQLPIMAAYHYPIADGFKLQVSTGPYIACGIFGAVDWKETSRYGDKESGSIDAFGDEDDTFGLKRFDLGWLFSAGVTWQKVYFGLQYDLGGMNIAHKDAWGDDYSIKNRCFSINVGYNF